MSVADGDSISVIALSTVASLQAFVRNTLCERDRLDPGQTPFFRTPVLRDGKVAGVLYHVDGPRMLRLSAIWSEAEHRILFYDPSGVHWLEVRLTEALEVGD